MADTKISALTAVSTLGATDIFPVVQGGASKKVTLSQLRVGVLQPPQLELPASGDTVTAGGGKYVIIDPPAGNIAALTLNLPVAPYDGQQVIFAFAHAITTLTMVPTAGTTIRADLTSATANSRGSWVYVDSVATWYRIG